MDRRRRSLWIAALAFAVLPTIADAQGAVRSLRMTGELDGVRSTLQLELQGEQPRPQLLEPVSGLALIRLEGQLGDSGVLDAMLTPLIGGGEPRSVRFVPEGSVAATPASTTSPASPRSAAASLDPRLVGRWVHQSMVSSSGGAGGSASFSTERTLEFAADGRVQQAVRSAGGGAQWSASSRGEVEFAGHWQARGDELWVARAQGGPYEFATRYRFSGAYLVTEGSGGRRIWSR